MNPQYTPQEFAAKVKAKYPQYANVDDNVLVAKMVEKYPEYKNQIVTPQSVAAVEQPESSVMEKTGGALNAVFGGGKIGEAIGAQIAKGNLGDTAQRLVLGRDLSPEEEAQVAAGPTTGQLAGDVARIGATFVPVGRIAGAVGSGLGAAGLGAGAARLVGNIVGGATAGAAADIGTSMAEGEKPSLGMGTAVGAGLSVVGAATRAIGGATMRGIGKVGAEGLGVTTGTSAETLEQAFNAARKGGAELDTLTQNLRGQTTPEQIVSNLRENIGIVNTQRQQAFRQGLAELGDNVVPTATAKTSLIDNLRQAGIAVKDGVLDFSGSKLRLVPAAQTKIQSAFNEVMNLADNSSLLDVDTSRQALKALQVAGDDPSANLANKLIDDAIRGVRGAGTKVPGYEQMLNQFGETSQFLDELQRGVMSGDRATIDQTYRRLATTLKTNNEQRLALVKELDEITGGSVLTEVAGQQLSEVMPRGIVRQIAAGMLGTATLTGGVSAGMLPALALASPRVVGEFVRSLGLAANKTDALIGAITQAQSVLVKIGAISAAVNDGGQNE